MVELIRDQDIVQQYTEDESGLKGYAEAVARPASVSEVIEVVKECYGKGIALLPSGLRTATTGAAVPFGGYVLSTEKLNRIIDIDTKRKIAEVEPGVITAELKAKVEEFNLYYPPDPTSEKECTIGGNVASNASGARTFRWGMTNKWVEGVEVVDGTSKKYTFFRRHVDKNTTGYLPFQDPVSLFIGSEGTLGVITRAWLRLIEHPGAFFGIFVFFEDFWKCIQFAVDVRLGRVDLRPRCVELFDETALRILGTHPKAFKIPRPGSCALFLEFDVKEGTTADEVACQILDKVKPYTDLAYESVIAQHRSELELFRELRHHIPETCNKIAKEYADEGGLKVSTEFVVPPDRLVEMLEFVRKSATENGVDILVIYGHIGNGHPHIFMRGRTRKEVAQRKRLAHLWYKRAVALGGAVAGEHGIGKTRRDFLRYSYPPEWIELMRKVKTHFDPKNILSPGNIFYEGESYVPEFWD